MRSIFLISLFILRSLLVLGEETYSETLKEQDLIIGVSLLGRKIEDDHEYEAAVVINYGGVDVSYDKASLQLIPTQADITVNGERVMVFTDILTLEYWEDDFEIVLNAISLDYHKMEGLKIERTKDLTALEIAGVKYLDLESLNRHWRDHAIDFDLFGNIGFGGRTEVLAFPNQEEINYAGDKYLTIDIGVGLNLQINPELPGSYFGGQGSELYIYTGHRYSRSEDLKHNRTYIGLELYGGKLSKNYTARAFIDFFWDNYDFLSPQFDQSVDAFGARFGINVSRE